MPTCPTCKRRLYFRGKCVWCRYGRKAKAKHDRHVAKSKLKFLCSGLHWRENKLTDEVREK